MSEENYVFIGLRSKHHHHKQNQARSVAAFHPTSPRTQTRASPDSNEICSSADAWTGLLYEDQEHEKLLNIQMQTAQGYPLTNSPLLDTVF